MIEVLIIDDEVGIREWLEVIVLEDYPDASISHASDGNEGIKKCLDQPFDLIFTDYSMPKVNGKEFLAMKMNIPNNKDTPVIFCSGSMPADLSSWTIREKLFFIDKPLDQKKVSNYMKLALWNGPSE